MVPDQQAIAVDEPDPGAHQCRRISTSSYDAITASDIWHLGFGYDQRLSSSIWAGLELSRRNVNSPYLGDPAEGERLTGYSIYDTGRAYLYWAATDRVAVSFGAEIERRRDDNDCPWRACAA